MHHARRGYVSSVRSADWMGFLNERLRVISVTKLKPANTRAFVVSAVLLQVPFSTYSPRKDPDSALSGKLRTLDLTM